MKTIYMLAGGLLLSGLTTAQVTDTTRAKRDTVIIRETRVVQAPQPEKAPDPDPTFHSGEFGVRFMPSFSRFEVRDAGGNVMQAGLVMSYSGGAMPALNSKHRRGEVESHYHT